MGWPVRALQRSWHFCEAALPGRRAMLARMVKPAYGRNCSGKKEDMKEKTVEKQAAWDKTPHVDGVPRLPSSALRRSGRRECRRRGVTSSPAPASLRFPASRQPAQAQRVRPACKRRGSHHSEAHPTDSRGTPLGRKEGWCLENRKNSGCNRREPPSARSRSMGTIKLRRWT